MTTLCIGGSLDGETVDTRAVTFHRVNASAAPEDYIRISEKGGIEFYMLCGMKPADALNAARELAAAQAATATA